MTRRCLLALLILVGLGSTALVPSSAGAEAHESSVEKIDYPGYGIEVTRLSGDQRKLTGTPRSFKRFVKARLDVLFEESGSKPRCATAPTVVVQRYDSRGWAKVAEGWYGPCAGGGYAAIYRKTASGWTQILGAQDLRFCQDLSWYGVTRFIAGSGCVTEDLKAVRYADNDETKASPEATARRATHIVGGLPVLPQEHVITDAALEGLTALADKGAYLAPGDCASAAEGGPLAAHLGGSPYGCVITATYKNDDVDSFMLRIDAGFVGTELVAIP